LQLKTKRFDTWVLPDFSKFYFANGGLKKSDIPPNSGSFFCESYHMINMLEF